MTLELPFGFPVMTITTKILIKTVGFIHGYNRKRTVYQSCPGLAVSASRLFRSCAKTTIQL